MAELDPKTRALLDLIASLGEPPPARQTPAEFRARRERGRDLVNVPWQEPALVRDVAIAGAAGPLRARIYDVADGRHRPTLIYFHGGGFLYGSLETHHPLCCRLAIAGGLRVISAEYRLAPEHPYPAAIEDAVAIAREVMANAQQYGADADRVALGGDSAGACLATVATRLLRRAGGPDPKFQLLIYPVVQAGEETASRQRYAEGYFLTREVMDWFDGHYLPAGVDRTAERVSPLRAATPAGLAPAYIVTAGFDPLLDEGRRYAEILARDGVAVQYVEYPDQIHGFFNFTAFSGAAVAAIEAAAKATARALA
jgi:acetyl esterase